MGIILTFPTAVTAQDCGGADVQLEFGNNHWVGHAYQLNGPNIPSKDTDFFEHTYKGKLTAEMLPSDNLNFSLTFDDPFDYAVPYDSEYFKTTCDSVRKSHFGITFRAKYAVPETGIYLISIRQDDGTALWINGNRVHNYWNRFKHDVHEGRTYLELEKGEVLDMVLNFFELVDTNRLTFSMIRYYGEGEIFNPLRNLCALDPDPEPFQSLGPAAFVSNLDPEYQWQYSLTGRADDWIDIEGATGETYDMPRLSDMPFGFGKIFFRRAASTPVDDPVYTQPIDITLTPASTDVDQTEFGEMQWYGYVYDKYNDDFHSGDFIGKLVYPVDYSNHRAEFDENFGGREGNFTGSSSSSVPGATYSGCAFQRQTFSVRYKMMMPVTPGRYNFSLLGDDGFRLKIFDGTQYLGAVNGEWAIDRWTNYNTVAYKLSEDIVITENTILYFTIEYTENLGGNRIQFKSIVEPFAALPVEWGEVSGNPCGDYNCINWETVQEKNTSHFEVERSKDGIQWTNLGLQVPAAGYSTQSIHYDIKDNGFPGKSTFYRVKQVDLDESFGYSDVIRVDNANYGRFMPYPFPNPTRDKIRFYFKEVIYRAELISQDYKMILVPETTKVGEHFYEINMERLKNMHYILTVIGTSGEREVFKIIKE